MFYLTALLIAGVSAAAGVSDVHAMKWISILLVLHLMAEMEDEK